MAGKSSASAKKVISTASFTASLVLPETIGNKVKACFSGKESTDVALNGVANYSFVGCFGVYVGLYGKKVGRWRTSGHVK